MMICNTVSLCQENFDIKNSNYDLASDIDKLIISKRDRELDFFETKFK